MQEAINVVGLTTDEIHEARKNGKITFQEVTQQYLDRIEEYNNQLNAIITTNPKALERAAELDKIWDDSGAISGVHGIPLVLKDWINTADMPTTLGNELFENVIPPSDGYVVRKFREAGGIVIGKSNVSEIMTEEGSLSSVGGQAHNPYVYSRTTGGSSSGVGAGVAASFGTIGIGTDTGGSIRYPAAFGNLIGLKPTRGLVSRDGVAPISSTQDAVGPITRTVTEAAILMDVIAGYDPADVSTARSRNNIPDSYTDYLNENALDGMRIGVMRQLFGPKTDQGNDPELEAEMVTEVIDKRLEDIESYGATVIDPITISNCEKKIEQASVSNDHFEYKRDFNKYLDELGEKAPVDTIEEVVGSHAVGTGREYDFSDNVNLDENTAYLRTLKYREELKHTILKTMENNGLDALVYPMASRIAPRIDDDRIYRTAGNYGMASHTGFPSITVPAGFDPKWETPVGIEFLMGPFEDHKLIELAYSYEQNRSPWTPPEDYAQL